MTARPTYRRLDIPSGDPAGSTIAFEMQPIVQLNDGNVKAFELLYRGPRPANWADVDGAVLHFLAKPQAGLAPVYMNLSNDILMAHGAEVFAQVAAANDVTFELSEAVSGYSDRIAIADKVNQLISVGARVALDDFGAGRDGLQRLYAIGRTAAVKIDREFLLTCMKRPDARRMLCMLIAQWRREGVRSIAEGVETAEMFAFAQQINVDDVQGWYIDALVEMSLVGEGG